MLEGRGQRILAVDCDRTVLELLQIRFGVAGYHTQLARTSSQALEMIRHVRPAALVIDVKIDEGMDGFELIRTIRHRHPDIHAPILLTGRSLTVEDVKRALSYGASSALLKPFSGADAVERIGRLLLSHGKPAPEPLLQAQPVAYL